MTPFALAQRSENRLENTEIIIVNTKRLHFGAGIESGAGQYFLGRNFLAPCAYHRCASDGHAAREAAFVPEVLLFCSFNHWTFAVSALSRCP